MSYTVILFLLDQNGPSFMLLFSLKYAPLCSFSAKNMFLSDLLGPTLAVGGLNMSTSPEGDVNRTYPSSTA